MTRFVYRFGGGVSDGEAGDKNLLGGKGANLAEMASIGLPVPPGFTISTEICAAITTSRAKHFRDGLAAEVAEGIAHIEAVDRQALRRSRRSAARLGPLGRARVDAGDDGHRPQPRPQRRDGRGPRRRLGRSRASPGTATAASSRCMPTSCSASITACSRKRWRSPRRTRASISTPISSADDWQRLVGRYQGDRRGGTGPRLSRSDPHEQLWGAIGAVFALVAGRPRQDLSPAERHPRTTGAPRSTSRRWCSAIWARHRPPASPSPAIPRPASAPITANF